MAYVLSVALAATATGTLTEPICLVSLSIPLSGFTAPGCVLALPTLLLTQMARIVKCLLSPPGLTAFLTTMQIIVLWLSLLGLASAFIPISRGVQSTTEPLHGVVIHLGDVDIADRECDRELTSYRESCKNTYHELISNVALQFGNDFTTESVKRASCCGIWEAKWCVVKAAEKLEVCSRHNVSSSYAQLPSDPAVKREVLDKCSEYQENSAVCDTHVTSAVFTLNSLAYFLVIFLAVVLLLLVALRLYQRKKEFDRYHESLQYNMVSRDADHVDVTEQEVMKTSTASTLTQ